LKVAYKIHWQRYTHSCSASQNNLLTSPSTTVCQPPVLLSI
jgi:hypothetical protein